MVSLRAHDWFTAQTVRQALFLKQPDEKVGEGEYLCVCVCVCVYRPGLLWFVAASSPPVRLWQRLTGVMWPCWKCEWRGAGARRPNLSPSPHPSHTCRDGNKFAKMTHIGTKIHRCCPNSRQNLGKWRKTVTWQICACLSCKGVFAGSILSDVYTHTLRLFFSKKMGARLVLHQFSPLFRLY